MTRGCLKSLKRISVAASAFACLLWTQAATAGSTAYTYDAVGRVTSVQYSNGASITYAYDTAGNRTSTVSALQPNRCLLQL